MGGADALASLARRRALVLGGLGFIGSNLARSLLDASVDVTVLDALEPLGGGSRQNAAGVEDRLTIAVGDVRDEAVLAPLLDGVSVVFNLVGQTSHLDSMTDPQSDLDLNCRAQLAVLEAVRKHSPDARVVFASTRQIYGRPQYLPVDERHPISPVDVNGIHKYAGEEYHRLYAEVYGTSVSILRLTNTYGPRMRVKDARQTFLGSWIRAAVRGEEIIVFGDGSQRRDLTYVDDVIDALALAATVDSGYGRAYNLGAERVVTLLELAELVTAIAGSGTIRCVPFPSERKTIDIGDYFADFSMIGTELGWRPAVDLEDGLERTIAFFHEHAEHYFG